MFVFDQLKRNDPQLRLLGVLFAAGLAVLFGGLWWVQIVSARDYQAHLETQSFRSVRIPAVRGKILDRSGAILAENRPVYNVSLYLDELRRDFDKAYSRETAVRRRELMQLMAAEEKKLNRNLTAQEKREFAISSEERNRLREDARYNVASNVVLQISDRLQKPLALDRTAFLRHYKARLALPYPVAQRIDATDIARFSEQSTLGMGVDLEVQSTRSYPFGTSAAHLLGHLKKDDSSVAGEEAFFDYRLPDYCGVLGMEMACEKELHGRAGAKSVLVNNLGYRQADNIWSPAAPGKNVVLTIDLYIQRAVEQAISTRGPEGAKTRAAVVVMDVRSGDILALASSPTFDPNYFVQGFPPGEYQRLQSITAEKNRATQENYRPGSIFKTVVGLACLENGLDPKATFDVQANPADPTKGMIYVGRRSIRDTAPPGSYDFRRALIHSSNSYFITNGIRYGVDKVVQLGRRLHLGERLNLGTRQETAGTFPDAQRIKSGWTDGDTANLCIGQGYIDVSPLQMAVLASALANGGKVLWPRLVDRIESADGLLGEPTTVFPKGRIRDNLGVKPSSFKVLKDAMLDDVHSPEGTGRFAAVPGFAICGKTGTAQVKNERNELIDYTTWFLSFAPYESPRYSVIVMVESGGSGGTTCAPIAHDIYAAIQQWEKAPTQPKNVVAQAR